MTPTEGVMKRFALLIALITTLFATPAVAHAAKVKLTGVPATLSQGEAFTVKGSAKKTVALTLSKDKKSDKRDVKLAKLKAKKGKFAGKVTIKATPGRYYAARVRGQGVHGEGDQGHDQGRPRRPAAGAERSCERPDLASRPGNENLPPAPTVTPTPGPGNPDPTPIPVPADPRTSPRSWTRRRDLGLRRDEVPLLAARTRSSATSSRARSATRRSRSCAARVQDRDGEPIEGVRVTVLDHHELGCTRTRADGEFDLAVNGGGVTLAVRARGLPDRPAHAGAELAGLRDRRRRRDGPGRPERRRSIDPNSDRSRSRSSRARESEDKDGERQATLLVPKGTDATMELPNGQTKPIGELKVRVTEFTYGDQGDEAMPGTLPANSGYTYAAEFSVDEALKAGATQVDFDQPLINYTENFIGAPVGIARPDRLLRPRDAPSGRRPRTAA